MYQPDDVAISKTNYQHHHEVDKRNTISSPKIGSKQRNSPVCEDKLLCIYFYPDHPDAGRSSSRMKGNYNQPITNNKITSEKTDYSLESNIVSPICEDTRSFCTYFYPDHPDAGLGRTNKNSNIGIIKQKTKGSDKPYLPLCEDSSSICTSAFKKKNNNYTAVMDNVIYQFITI